MSPAFSSLVRPERVSRWHIRQEGGNACELLTDMLIAIGGGGGVEKKFEQAGTAMVRWHCLPSSKLRSCLFCHASQHTGGRYDANDVLDRAEMEVCDGRRGAVACPLLPSSAVREASRHDSHLLAQHDCFIPVKLMEVEVWRCSCWASLRESPECSAASSQLPTR